MTTPYSKPERACACAGKRKRNHLLCEKCEEKEMIEKESNEYVPVFSKVIKYIPLN